MDFRGLGSWLTYALGSENQSLPAYVAIPDPRGVPQNGSNNWGPGFLPAAFQGTVLSSKESVRHLVAPGNRSEADRATHALLQAHESPSPKAARRRRQAGRTHRQLRVGRPHAIERTGD